MIYRTFRSNIPLVILVLFPLLVIFSLREWINPSPSIAENLSPLYEVVFSLFHSNALVSYALAYIVIISTAVLFNWLINNSELFDRQTFLPSLIYVVMVGSFPQSTQLHPVLIANFFLVLALWRLFQVKRDLPASQEMFDAAFLISIAALMYPPFSMFIAITWIALIIFRPFVWREWLLALLGFAFPVAVTAGLFFIFNQFDELSFYTHPKSTYRVDIFSENVMIRSAASSLILMNFILAGYSSFAGFVTNSLRFKRLVTMFSFFGVFTILIMLYCRFVSNEEIYPVLIALPGALFFTFYYQHNKSFIASVMFYLSLLFALVNIYFF